MLIMVFVLSRAVSGVNGFARNNRRLYNYKYSLVANATAKYGEFRLGVVRFDADHCSATQVFRAVR